MNAVNAVEAKNVRVSHRKQLLSEGFLVLQKVLPQGLVADCRDAYRGCAELVRPQFGPLSQRVPVGHPALQRYLKLIKEIREGKRLRRAMNVVPGREYTYAADETTYILVEPTWSCTMPNHRDWLNQKPGADLQHLLAHWLDPYCFLQFNLAVEPDSCLFVLPRSHRWVDLIIEARRSRPPRYLPEKGTEVEALAFSDGYWQAAQRDAGAVQIHLEPGDMALYFSNMVHGAKYSSQKPRLTFHDELLTGEFKRFIDHQHVAWERHSQRTDSQPWWDLPPEELARLSIPPKSAEGV